jgi:hypothetical protein
MPTTEVQSPDVQVVCLADSIVEPYEDSERRGHMRLSQDDVRWLRSARLKYGPDVRVIDISAGGILVETQGQLRPDANIVFELSGPMKSILVPSKVLRCRVASFAEVMRYQGACAFKRPVEIPDLVRQAIEKGSPTSTPAAASKSGASTSWQKVVARFREVAWCAATPLISIHRNRSCIYPRSRIRATRCSCRSRSSRRSSSCATSRAIRCASIAPSSAPRRTDARLQ